MWRDEVEALWSFLHRAYFISGNSNCSTHVHVSRAEDFTLLELKRISQVVIHFEPGLEALMPDERRANEFARKQLDRQPSFRIQKIFLGDKQLIF